MFCWEKKFIFVVSQRLREGDRTSTLTQKLFMIFTFGNRFAFGDGCCGYLFRQSAITHTFFSPGYFLILNKIKTINIPKNPKESISHRSSIRMNSSLPLKYVDVPAKFNYFSWTKERTLIMCLVAETNRRLPKMKKRRRVTEIDSSAQQTVSKLIVQTKWSNYLR